LLSAAAVSRTTNQSLGTAIAALFVIALYMTFALAEN
jgi:hypothetical protein